jgi:hypothetical protein
VTFAAGETSKTIDVTVSGDNTVELDETFTVTISDPMGTGVVLGTTVGTGTITNDDSAAVTITDVTPNEDDMSVEVSFTVDNPVDGGFTVDVSTGDGTATLADSDYTVIVDQTITFAGTTAGEVQTVTVNLVTDTKVEADEVINLSMDGLVANTVNAANINVTDTGTVTIVNDDTATVTITNTSGNEDDVTDISVSVTVDNAVDGGFTVDVSTANGTAELADSDYAAVVSQTLTFTGTAGETQSFDVNPTADTDTEPD